MLEQILQQNDKGIIKALVGTSIVYSVYQTHVPLQCDLVVYQISYGLQSIGLRELLQDGCCLILVLVEHLVYQAARCCTDYWL